MASEKYSLVLIVSACTLFEHKMSFKKTKGTCLVSCSMHLLLCNLNFDSVSCKLQWWVWATPASVSEVYTPSPASIKRVCHSSKNIKKQARFSRRKQCSFEVPYRVKEIKLSFNLLVTAFCVWLPINSPLVEKSVNLAVSSFSCPSWWNSINVLLSNYNWTFSPWLTLAWDFSLKMAALNGAYLLPTTPSATSPHNLSSVVSHPLEDLRVITGGWDVLSMGELCLTIALGSTVQEVCSYPRTWTWYWVI